MADTPAYQEHTTDDGQVVRVALTLRRLVNTNPDTYTLGRVESGVVAKPGEVVEVYLPEGHPPPWGFEDVPDAPAEEVPAPKPSKAQPASAPADVPVEA